MLSDTIFSIVLTLEIGHRFVSRFADLLALEQQQITQMPKIVLLVTGVLLARAFFPSQEEDELRILIVYKAALEGEHKKYLSHTLSHEI